MKTDILTHSGFTEVNADEMTRLGGGDGFAYDAGTVLRFLGISLSNGGGIYGNICAISDAVVNYVINNQ